jgi:hypothetical protein
MIWTNKEWHIVYLQNYVYLELTMLILKS